VIKKLRKEQQLFLMRVSIMIENDVEAIIICKRKEPFYKGYRPGHLVKEDYLTTGIHQCYEVECISNGELALGTIKFLSPEECPHCLWEGKIINIQEGSNSVGYAFITRIFNNLLKLE
jgi:elongation factor Tu